MKKTMMLGSILSALLILIIFETTTHAGAFSLKIASARPKTDVQLQSIEWWAKEVEKRTDGAVKFSFFWSGALVKAGEELEAVRSGLVDFSPVTVGDYSSKLPLANVFYSVPFGPDQETAGEIMNTLYSEFPAFRKEIEQYNQKVLYFLPTPTYDIGSLIALRTLEDFKGKKIIVHGKNMSAWVSALGAAAVAVPAPERYMALKTGVADGEVFPTLSINDFKHGEVIKYITEVGLGAPITWFFTVNMDTWHKLSPEIQKTMEEAAKEAAGILVANAKKAKGDAKTRLTQSGVTFYAMSDAEKQKWADLLPDLPAEWANEMDERGQPGWEIMSRFIALAKASGYTFPREWAQKK